MTKIIGWNFGKNEFFVKPVRNGFPALDVQLYSAQLSKSCWMTWVPHLIIFNRNFSRVKNKDHLSCYFRGHIVLKFQWMYEKFWALPYVEAVGFGKIPALPSICAASTSLYIGFRTWGNFQILLYIEAVGESLNMLYRNDDLICVYVIYSSVHFFLIKLFI